MTRLKSLLATGWAVLATPLILATFIGNGAFAAWLARSTGAVVSPWYTGGELARQIEHPGYRTLVRRPVFDALVGQRPVGFVQVEWIPAQDTALPESLREAIDYDGDAVADFTVELSTRSNTATLTPHTPRVIALERVYRLDREKVVRVRLRRE